MNGYSELENLLLRLIEEGLKGIEVYYPEHSPLEVARYKTLAERYSLLITGGTDYHGIEKNGLDMGVGRGEMKLSYLMVEELKAARNQSLSAWKSRRV